MMKATLLFILLSLSLSAAQKKPVTIDDLSRRFGGAHAVQPVWSPDDEHFIYVDQGKLMLFDVQTKNKRDLLEMKTLEGAAAKAPEPELFDWTNRRVSEKPFQWFSDGRRLLVAEGGDLFIVHLDGAPGGQANYDALTHTPVDEVDPKLSPDNRYVSFRREQDLYVLEIATKKETRLTHNGSDTLLNGQLDWVYPEELDLGTAHWWSPDSKHIAYMQLDTQREPIYPAVSMLPVHAMLEPERYPQAGDPNPDVRVGVVDVTGGATRWMDLGDPRDHLIARVTWVPDSSAVTALRLNRIQNELDLFEADQATGHSRVLIHEADPYWINVTDEPKFLSTGEFIWSSERDGFRHFYLYNANGQVQKQITSGDWVDLGIQALDEQNRVLYFTSNEGDPMSTRLYKIALDGTGKARLTALDGTHRISMSPHGRYFTDMASNFSTPWSQDLRGADGKTITQLMKEDRSTEQDFAVSKPEVVQIPAADGQMMYGALIRPAPFDEHKKYPVIVQIYGGPGVQAVTNMWRGLGMEQVYASSGYIVWAMDNRGSYNRGHKFESVIFRDMGKHELEDQLRGIDYLKKLSYVDAARIGITGWSYGGYMTLYSVLNAPETFRAAEAGAPVTDWHNYDSIYTERYMGLPEVNAEGYERSSDVKKAAQLKAKLLMLHNIEDDNVHFTNTLQMVNALEMAQKQFKMMVFPQKSHGVGGPAARDLAAAQLDFFNETLKQ